MSRFQLARTDNEKRRPPFAIHVTYGNQKQHEWHALCGVHIDSHLLKTVLVSSRYRPCATCFAERARLEAK